MYTSQMQATGTAQNYALDSDPPTRESLVEMRVVQTRVSNGVLIGETLCFIGESVVAVPANQVQAVLAQVITPEDRARETRATEEFLRQRTKDVRDWLVSNSEAHSGGLTLEAADALIASGDPKALEAIAAWEAETSESMHATYYELFERPQGVLDVAEVIGSRGRDERLPDSQREKTAEAIVRAQTAAAPAVSTADVIAEMKAEMKADRAVLLDLVKTLASNNASNKKG